MTDRYEVGGVLEDSRLIRLNDPLPCKQGPVKVVIETLQPEATQSLQPNSVALEALDRLLAEADGESSEIWTHLEKIIDEHPRLITSLVALTN
jgi:hypothetical protein